MDRREADRAIAALGEMADRIAGQLYAIDSHPALTLLKSATTSGRTAQIAAALAPEIDAQWSEFTALGDVLESVRAARAIYRPAEAQWAAMAADLSAWSRRAASVVSACTSVAGILDDVDACTSAVAAAVAPLSAALDALRRDAAELGIAAGLGSAAAPAGPADPGGTAALAGRVTRATADAYADPVAAAPGGRLSGAVRERIDEVFAVVRTASARLATARRLRDGFAARVAATAERIDALGTAEAGAADAFARASAKIAEPGLPEAPHAAGMLRARLDGVTGRADTAADWAHIADEFTALDAAIDRASQRAAELAAAADGLVDRRDELRGRLEAYRAKASARRVDEDGTLAGLHERARALLYTAPCDLPAATRAVRAYQDALAGLRPGGKDALR